MMALMPWRSYLSSRRDANSILQDGHILANLAEKGLIPTGHRSRLERG